MVSRLRLVNSYAVAKYVRQCIKQGAFAKIPNTDSVIRPQIPRFPPVYTEQGGKIVRREPPLIPGAFEPVMNLDDYYYRKGYLSLDLWSATDPVLLEGLFGRVLTFSMPSAEGTIKFNTDASVKLKGATLGGIARVREIVNETTETTCLFAISKTINHSGQLFMVIPSVLLKELFSIKMVLNRANSQHYQHYYPDVLIATDSLNGISLINSVLSNDRAMMANIFKREQQCHWTPLLRVCEEIITILKCQWGFQENMIPSKLAFEFRECNSLADYCTRVVGRKNTVIDVPATPTFVSLFHKDTYGYHIRFPPWLHEEWWKAGFGN